MHWRQIHTFDPMPSRFSKCCCNSDTLLNVFLAIAVDNLANAQELTKVGRLRFLSAKPNISYVVPCFHCGAFLFWLRGWRMKRSRKRRPIRSWHCRRHWKWRKSAPCQLPTFRLLRKFKSISNLQDFASQPGFPECTWIVVHACPSQLFTSVTGVPLPFLWTPTDEVVRLSRKPEWKDSPQDF